MHVSVDNLCSQPPLVYLAFLVLSLVPLYILSYEYRLQHPYGLSSTRSHSNPYPPSSPDFEKKWLETQLIAPFNPSPLRRYCNQTITWWRPNLTFHLPNANGGIGNIKGNFIDYFMNAIEAGATSLVLPNMMTRAKDDLFDVWAGRQPFSAFFNESVFLERMGQACPEMTIVKETEGMLAKSWMEYFSPPSRRVDENPLLSGVTAQEYGRAVDAWVRDTTGKGIDEQDNVEISVDRRLWEFDTFSLPWNVRRELGRVLQIRDDVRGFAAEVVKNLGLQFNLSIDASEIIPTRLDGRFFGGHLRTESDAVTAGFVANGTTDFDTQTDSMIAHARKHNLSTLYIATGEPADLLLFRAKCAALKPPLNITSKFDLLSLKSKTQLKKLTWDQQALVDMEVLQRSTVYMGMSRSSFSFQIALTRNQYLMDMGRVTDPYAVADREGEQVPFDDGISRITAKLEGLSFKPLRGMWP